MSGVKNVQQAYVAKTMQFRRFFFATLGGTVFSRMLVALPVGALTLFAAQVSVAWLDRKAAVDE